MTRIILALVALFAFATAASAQVRQSGQVTPGHPVMWTTDGVVQDGGTSINGALSSVGIMSTALQALGINDAVPPAPFHQLTLGSAPASGYAALDYEKYGGAPALPFKIIINGIDAIVVSGTGSVVIPSLTSSGGSFSVANIQVWGGDPTGIKDSTAALNAAIATGLPVYIPPGKFLIDLPAGTPCPTIAAGQTLFGSGSGAITSTPASTIIADQNFNLATTCTGIITLAHDLNGSSTLRDFGFNFYQPNSLTVTRADIVPYPPAVYADAGRYFITRIRFEMPTVCIDGRGSAQNTQNAGSGGAFISDIECGSFNYGLMLGSRPPATNWGAKDGVHVKSWHQWPFGAGSNLYNGVYADNVGECMNLGDVEGLSAYNIGCFRQKVHLNSDAKNGWFSIVDLSLDGGGANFIVEGARFLNVTGGYSSAGKANNAALFNDPAVDFRAGSATLTNWHIQSGIDNDGSDDPAGDFQVTGGSLTWNGGQVQINGSIQVGTWCGSTAVPCSLTPNQAIGSRYVAGKYVWAAAANKTYIQTVSVCQSSTTGTGPSGTGSAIPDGTCLWNYFANGKTAVATWAPATTYTQKMWGFVAGSNGTYQQTVASCTSAATGAGPTGTGSGIADGSCSWNFIATGHKLGIDDVCAIKVAGSGSLVLNDIKMRPGDNTYYSSGYICQVDPGALRLADNVFNEGTSTGPGVSFQSDVVGNGLNNNHFAQMDVVFPPIVTPPANGEYGQGYLPFSPPKDRSSLQLGGYNFSGLVTAGGDLTAVGFGALNHIVDGADEDTALGAFTCSGLTTALRTTCVGAFAGNLAVTNQGATLLGAEAGRKATGDHLTIIGDQVAQTLATGSKDIVIGADITVDVPAANTSNMLNIGNLIFGNLSNATGHPAISACGTGPTVDGKSNNKSGTVTVGTGTPASCTITFAGTGYASWNHCRVTSQKGQTAVANFGYSYTLTAITVTATSLLTDVIDYDCDGY
jgi:hypothetical protein